MTYSNTIRRRYQSVPPLADFRVHDRVAINGAKLLQFPRYKLEELWSNLFLPSFLEDHLKLKPLMWTSNCAHRVVGGWLRFRFRIWLILYLQKDSQLVYVLVCLAFSFSSKNGAVLLSSFQRSRRKGTEEIHLADVHTAVQTDRVWCLIILRPVSRP